MAGEESSDKRSRGRKKGRGGRAKSGESFAELFEQGVRSRPERPAPERPVAEPRKAPAAPRERSCAAVVFELEQEGEEYQGRAPGVSRRELKRFFAEPAEPAREVDLHGLTAAQGRAAVQAALAQVRDEGGRWLRVIHGRGLRSQDGAVLKRSLPGWLAEAPHGGAVLAFVCSRRLAGATGATRVWLRREGPGSGGSR